MVEQRTRVPTHKAASHKSSSAAPASRRRPLQAGSAAGLLRRCPARFSAPQASPRLDPLWLAVVGAAQHALHASLQLQHTCGDGPSGQAARQTLIAVRRPPAGRPHRRGPGQLRNATSRRAPAAHGSASAAPSCGHPARPPAARCRAKGAPPRQAAAEQRQWGSAAHTHPPEGSARPRCRRPHPPQARHASRAQRRQTRYPTPGRRRAAAAGRRHMQGAGGVSMAPWQGPRGGQAGGQQGGQAGASRRVPAGQPGSRRHPPSRRPARCASRAAAAPTGRAARR